MILLRHDYVFPHPYLLINNGCLVISALWRHLSHNLKKSAKIGRRYLHLFLSVCVVVTAIHKFKAAVKMWNNAKLWSIKLTIFVYCLVFSIIFGKYLNITFIYLFLFIIISQCTVYLRIWVESVVLCFRCLCVYGWNLLTVSTMVQSSHMQQTFQITVSHSLTIMGKHHKGNKISRCVLLSVNDFFLAML